MKIPKGILAASLLLLVLGFASSAKAGSVTDTTLNVTYTATATFVPGPGNVYDVFLTVDATAFSKSSGFLTAVSMQFKTGSDIASSVTLLMAPGGPGAWGLDKVGGVDASGCNGKGGAGGFVCFQNVSASDPGPASGKYTFEFAVTMPGTDALTASSDIRIDFNKTLVNTNKNNLGITSMGITIQPGPTPEPASLLLLGTGLLAMGGVIRRKIGV